MSKIAFLKKRYKTIASVHKMVQAMQVAAVTQLKRTQGKLKWSNRYRQSLEELLHDGIPYSAFTQSPEYDSEKTTLICFITSSKGFCSGFNENVYEKMEKLIDEEHGKKRKTRLVVLGKKGEEYCRRKSISYAYHSSEVVAAPSHENIGKFLDYLIDQFISGKTEKVVIIFNAFKSLVSQKAVAVQLLPIQAPQGFVDTRMVYVEPSKERFAEEVSRSYLLTMLYDAILQSIVGELGRRLMTLKEATDNSSDILKELRLELNKVRQASITQELAEILSTFETLREEEGV